MDNRAEQPWISIGINLAGGFFLAERNGNIASFARRGQGTSFRLADSVYAWRFVKIVTNASCNHPCE